MATPEQRLDRIEAALKKIYIAFAASFGDDPQTAPEYWKTIIKEIKDLDTSIKAD